MTMQSVGAPLLAPVVPRLCLTGFTFSQPFLTFALISYLGDAGTSPKNYGYGLIAASFLVYTGIAVHLLHGNIQYNYADMYTVVE